MHEVWEGIFTTHGECPARKAIHYAAFDDDATILQLQAVAVLGARDRRDFLLENVPVHETVNDGRRHWKPDAVVWDLWETRGKLETLDQQIEWAFKHVHTFMREAVAASTTSARSASWFEATTTYPAFWRPGVSESKARALSSQPGLCAVRGHHHRS